MNVSVYDILSKIFPGGVIYGAFLFNNLITKPASVTDVLLLVLLYLVGYFIDAAASMIEPALFWLMGGKPSERLLDPKHNSRFKLGKLEALNRHLQEVYPNHFEDKGRLFNIMSSVVNYKGNARVNTFFEAYIFARNIFLSVLLSSVLTIVVNRSWALGLAMLGLSIIAFSRAKARGYYYAREMTNCYIEQKEL